MDQVFSQNTLHDHIAAHGMGDPTPEGCALGRRLIETGDDYATAAHEVVARGLTHPPEEDGDDD
ncbi:conserved hypothetical protein (plasmid) [Thioalkalivibrio sp. K90mix]|uniref:hypothetical protein n=1 Tax=Thioalkalivibrio sp. (strain K90mix) TaxID=396595 RepID=UPI000195ABA8|nr:hypothetical protein [Thioalkalivibrio sp. K90mix]ADC73139.1 conserved hypothetical protein [Thioalkalivibrio sp. K90mix]